MGQIGHNSESGRQLASFIERVERLRADKKQISAEEAAVLAEAKSAGFVPAIIRHVVKIRAMKPHQRQEAEALTDTYLHATGMASETPLHRIVGAMKADIASREQVIEAMKAFVPENGAITVDAGGGRPVRLTRDKDGKVTAAEILETPPPTAATMGSVLAAPDRDPPPDVDEAGAEQLGRDAYAENKPIVANPFPFGDPRRPRWDEGWRAASGSDGMGPGGREP